MEVFGDILESIEKLQGPGFDRELLLANSLLKCIVTFAMSNPDHQEIVLVDEDNQKESLKPKTEVYSDKSRNEEFQMFSLKEDVTNTNIVIPSKTISITKLDTVNSAKEFCLEPPIVKESIEDESAMVLVQPITLNKQLSVHLTQAIYSEKIQEQNKDELFEYPFVEECKSKHNVLPSDITTVHKSGNIYLRNNSAEPTQVKDNQYEEKLLESINVANPILGHDKSQSQYYLKCKFCEYIQSTKVKNPHKTFQEHMQLSHNLDNVMVVCKTQNCSFERKVLWSRKNGVHNFSRVVSWMLHHSQAVHGGVWQDCDECGKKFADPNDLKLHKGRHLKMSHKRKKRLERKNKIIPCEVCGKEMKNSSIQVHVQNCHSTRQDLFCSVCSFSTKYSSYLQEHEDGHTKQINCMTCGKTCSTRSMLRRHTRIEHEGGLLLCSFCEYKADAPSRLAMHEETHNERTITCDECDYVGTTKINLENHMRRHKDPRFECKLCDYKTYDSSNFGKHKIVKHGSVKLKCEHCDYESKSKRSLKKHKERHIKLSL